MNNNKPNWLRGVCIGKGSFGTVSLAVDNTHGGVFAVKSVNQSSGQVSEALENEIRILKSLSSPYVVGFLGEDVTSEFSSVYRNLHMEYMPGGTVADMVRHGEDATVRSYTRCIVAALSYIHGRNIVHCDVKGRNVLVGETSGTAKLADFGSAVEMGGRSFGMRGSPLWMAPEVVRREYQGPESDVWSLGCTVIEMVTGKPAWQDRGVDTLFQIGYSNDLPEFSAQFSGELRDFLHKCLRRDRSERWSADQLLQHPFVSSYSSPEDKKWSPRCVFDWPEYNLSDEETSEENINLNSDARQRIGILASNSGANWESDGWELVRNATVTGWETEEEVEDELEGGSPEYSGPGESVGGSGRTNREHRDGNECTNNHAQGTTDTDSSNSCWCCMSVSLKKLLEILLFNSNAIRHIYYKQCIYLILQQILVFFLSTIFTFIIFEK